MAHQRYSNDSVHWYMNELTSRIVVESGNPSDRFHLGKIILQSLKDAPDFVMQIDGATDISETNGSVLRRSVRCALSFRHLGLHQGDVIVLMAPHHTDLAVPFYAAVFLGIIVAPVDRTLSVQELQRTFGITKPKLIFCQNEKLQDTEEALKQLGHKVPIVTFDPSNYPTLAEFVDETNSGADVNKFRASDYNPDKAVGFLIPTSGTTGLPKFTSTTYKNFAITSPYRWARYHNFPTPTRMNLVCSPLQWLTALDAYIISPVMGYTRLQSSMPLTQEHTYHLINTYRPTFTLMSPTMMTTLMREGDRNRCDFTCFEQIMLAGSAVPVTLVELIKKVTPATEVSDAYGISELTCIAFHADNPPPGSCGKPMGCFQYRLIDIETQKDILEPNKPGELWMKGPGICKEYFDNPKATEETFEDNWFKTGDLFKRDEHMNFYFLERIKLLLKYKNHQISPVEIESVIRRHPGVVDVAVTGIPDEECGDLPVACVVARAGDEVSAQEIKDLVKEALTDSKQLRGGVIFMSEIPMTPTTKVHVKKLKQMVLQMDRQ